MIDGFPFFNPELHRRLFQANEKLHALHARPTDVTWDEYSAILAELCAALNTSLENGLREAIRYLADRGKKEPHIVKQAEQILGDVSAFSQFLQLKKDILRQCNLSENTAEAMIQCVNFMKSDLKTIPPRIDANSLISNIETFRDLSCEASRTFEKHLKARKDDFNTDRFLLNSTGTTLVVADLSLLAWTLGASTVFTTISVSVGGTLLTWERKLTDPGKKKPKRFGF